MPAGGDKLQVSPRTRVKGRAAQSPAMAQTPPQSRPAVQAQAGLAPAVLDLAEEVLLQELFSRCCSHGKDRAPTPAYCPTAVRGFGPARRGSAVPMLQEDVARFRSRLRKEGSRGGFVFSAFAAHALEAGAPRMDGAQFAKFCRERSLLDERVLDEYLMSTGLTAAEADIIYRQVLPRGRRSLGFEEFRRALLPRIARKKDLPLAELVRQLLGDGDSRPGPLNIPVNSPLNSPRGREPLTPGGSAPGDPSRHFTGDRTL